MNVICINTRKIVHNPNRFDSYSDLLRSLLLRLNERPDLQDLILKIQGSNQPYYGDCVHAIYPREFSNIPFPMPNLTCPPQKVLGKDILTANSPDPLAHLDMRYRSTYRILKHVEVIYTRSDLIAHDDYIEQLNPFVKINIVYSSEDDEINRILEPGCPSYKRRLKAYNKLKDLGYNVSMLQVKLKTKKAV